MRLTGSAVVICRAGGWKRFFRWRNVTFCVRSLLHLKFYSLFHSAKEADHGNAWVVHCRDHFSGGGERRSSLFICEARFASRRKMDQDEEAVQTSGSKTLLVRHLPAELSQDEKEDLLKYFGAQSVRVFPNRGRMVSSDASFSYSGLFTLSHGLFLPAETRCLCNIWKREIGSKSKIFTCQTVCISLSFLSLSFFF